MKGRPIWCLGLAWMVGCAPLDPGQLTVVDDTRQLRQEGLQIAAEPLLQRGAHLMVFFLPQGDEADVARRLQAAGQWRDGQITPRGLAVYVSLRPRYSDLRAGSGWSDLLSGPVLEGVRSHTLNPALRDGIYQTAAEDCLRVLSRHLEVGATRQRRWRQGLLAVLAAALALWGLSGTRLASRMGRRTPVRPRAADPGCTLEAARRACRNRLREAEQLLQGLRQQHPEEVQKEWLKRLQTLPEQVTASLVLADLRGIEDELRRLYSTISERWQSRFPRSWEQRFQGTFGSLPEQPTPGPTPPSLATEPPLQFELPERAQDSSSAAGDW